MAEVVRHDAGLRTGRRISHCFVMDVPAHADPLIVTDAAINIAPTLEEKVDILQNAIDLAHALAFPQVRVAILSAMETVNPKVPSTLEAAALCKMVDRRQITGALVDGPLALDNAIDPEAARIKQIDSPVAGHANVLMVPDLEAGNMLAKSLSFLAGADAAGIVLGARVPIILTSRADSLITRLASCAVAMLVANGQREAAAHAGDGMADVILVLNAGSSSIKFSAFDVQGDTLGLIVHGQVDGLYTAAAHFSAVDHHGEHHEQQWAGVETFGHHEGRADRRVPGGSPGRASSRGGGPSRRAWRPTLQRPGARHARDRGRAGQAHAARAVASTAQPDADSHPRNGAARHRAGGLLRHGIPPHAARGDPGVRAARVDHQPGRAPLWIPRASYEYIASVLPDVAPQAARGRTVVAHLGNGASMCALVAGKSVASTMGFTAVDGLPMGTRCGNLDRASCSS